MVSWSVESTASVPAPSTRMAEGVSEGKMKFGVRVYEFRVHITRPPGIQAQIFYLPLASYGRDMNHMVHKKYGSTLVWWVIKMLCCVVSIRRSIVDTRGGN